MMSFALSVFMLASHDLTCWRSVRCSLTFAIPCRLLSLSLRIIDHRLTSWRLSSLRHGFEVSNTLYILCRMMNVVIVLVHAAFRSS